MRIKRKAAQTKTVLCFFIILSIVGGCRQDETAAGKDPIRQAVAKFPKGAITQDYLFEVRETLLSLLKPRSQALKGYRVKVEQERSGSLQNSPHIQSSLLTMQTSDDFRLRAILLTPDNARDGNTSLIIALHGHGTNGIGGLFVPNNYQKGIAITLAKSGYSVLAVETRSFGSSKTDLPHYAYVQELRKMNKEFHGQVLSDNIEILNWLFYTDRLKPKSVGLIGCSMGAISALFLSCLDPRIDSCLIAGGGGSWEESFARDRHCQCSLIPGLPQRLDSPQIIAAVQCDHFAFDLGKKDMKLGYPNFKSIEKKVLSLNNRSSVKCKYQVHHSNLGHEYDVDFVLDYFGKVMSLNGEHPSQSD